MVESIQDLFHNELKVINIGLLKFSEQLEKQGVKVVQIDWTPPAGGDQELIDLLNDLL